MSLRGLILCVQLKIRCGVFLRTLTATYKTNRGCDATLGIYNEQAEPRDRVEKAKFIQEAEDMENLFDFDSPTDFLKATQGDKLWWKAHIKRKIIERKYFKNPQEDNLLTWDAKEQMRYLNQEYPNEWTVDRLANSFPITRDGVIKILHSSWYPKSLSEVLRHDRRVRKRWLVLKSGSEEGGPIELRYHKLIENGKLALAAGNPLLPAPLTKKYFLTASNSQPLNTIVKFLPLEVDSNQKRKHQRESTCGPFESLVKDYCKQKEDEKTDKKQEQAEEIRVLYAKHKVESQLLLQEVVSEIIPLLTPENNLATEKPVQQDLLGATVESEHEFAVKDRGSRDNIDEDKSLFDKMLRMTNDQAEAILRGESEILEGEKIEEESSASYKHLKRKSLRRHLAHRQEERLKREIKQLQMKGTGKIQRDRRVEKYDEEDWQMSRNQVKRYAQNKEALQVMSRIQYDTPRNGNCELSKKAAYIYTEQTGYQYPLGRTDPEATIKVHKLRQRSTQPKLYQKGKAFYDEHGKLLYRIP